MVDTTIIIYNSPRIHYNALYMIGTSNKLVSEIAIDYSIHGV